jgi:hypothetical protein
VSDDLVKRLRDSFVYDQQHYAPDPLVAEAADTIETQAAEIERLKVECQAQYHRGYYDGRTALGVSTNV